MLSSSEAKEKRKKVQYLTDLVTRRFGHLERNSELNVSRYSIPFFPPHPFETNRKKYPALFLSLRAFVFPLLPPFSPLHPRTQHTLTSSPALHLRLFRIVSRIHTAKEDWKREKKKTKDLLEGTSKEPCSFYKVLIELLLPLFAFGRVDTDDARTSSSTSRIDDRPFHSPYFFTTRSTSIHLPHRRLCSFLLPFTD